MPDFKPVPSCRHVRDLKTSIPRRKREMRSRQGDDFRAHLRVDVAENVGDTHLREAHFSDRSAFVEAEIERFPVVDGKNVVKKWVLVGELDCRSHCYRQHIVLESLVFLEQAHCRPWRNCFFRANVGEPHYGVCIACVDLGALQDVYLASDGAFLRAQQVAQDEDQDWQARSRFQKRTPAARLRWSPVALSPSAGAVSRCRYSTANRRNEFGS